MRIIHLYKFIENIVMALRVNANAGIGDRELYLAIQLPGIQADFTALGIFDRIAQEVTQNLGKQQWVRVEPESRLDITV